MAAEPTKIEMIFTSTLEKRSSAERTAYLDDVCRGDAELRTRVEELLKAHDEAGDFLESPDVDLGATASERPHLIKGPDSKLAPGSTKPSGQGEARLR